MSEIDSKPIRAAGGIVQGVGRNKGKIAIIRRNRYGGEIALPKGKLNGDEKEEEAALREVEEETGIKAELCDLVGTTQYSVEGRPKTVTYFLMNALDDAPTQPLDSGEVGSVEWLTPADASKVLSHAEDKKLIERVFEDRPGNVAEVPGALRHWFNNAPERARLEAAIKDATIELAMAGPAAPRGRWWQSANRHLAAARTYLADDNLQQGWSSLNSANRLMLLDEGNPQAPRMAAIELLHETEKKLTGWRAKAISGLILDKNGEVPPNIEPIRVVRAFAIRDNQFETDYFKITLRRWHLQQMFALLAACILLTLIVCWFLPPPFNDVKLILAVLLFGTMGAALSVARGLIKTDLSAKIPTQKIGSFVIWMRPIIGAAAALVAFVLLSSGAIRLFNWEPTDLAVILTVATVAGFSERFIVGALEKMGDGGGASSQKQSGG